MRADVGGVSGFRVMLRWAVLLLVGWLAGCATVPTGKSSPRNAASARCPLPRNVCPETGGEPTEPTVRGYIVPGRKPGSEMPWEFFLGNAAHRLIAYMYKANHPGGRVYCNTETILNILRIARVGDVSRLLPEERILRPDITDITDVASPYVFEIKPWNEQGLQEGRRDVRFYLAVLNRAVAPETCFLGGTDFQGEILIRFARGQYIWRLAWQTTEAGLVQYRWTRSQQRFASEAAAYEAGQWVELTEQELREFGGWVGQAVEDMVARRERLATFSGAVGIVIDLVGDAAVGFFSGEILGRLGSGPESQQPPTQAGGQVIPFPARPSPSPPVRLPATGMSLPR